MSCNSNWFRVKDVASFRADVEKWNSAYGMSMSVQTKEDNFVLVESDGDINEDLYNYETGVCDDGLFITLIQKHLDNSFVVLTEFFPDTAHGFWATEDKFGSESFDGLMMKIARGKFKSKKNKSKQ